MYKRFEYLDVMKAIAIIAVVLYHIGYTQYGYLGVDIFLVVNGFLLAKAFKELSSFRGGGKFLINRLLRLYPITLLASGFCLLWGSYWMLPYEYQDLAQSVIATDLFANNILMSIKSADYWNVLNDYKPLMHTWYLGIIVQFYAVFSLIIILAKKIIRTKKDITAFVVCFSLIISLVLYLMPNFNPTQKFYFLPFRIFEFCAGCLTAYWVNSKSSHHFGNKPLTNSIAVVAYLLTFGLLFVNVEYIPAPVKLLTTVLLTCILLITLPHVNLTIDKFVSNKWFAIIGRMSFSIYIWHQIVFAFCRYSFTTLFDAKTFAITILLTAILSYLSYSFVEQTISNHIKEEHGKRNTLIVCVCTVALLLCISFYLNSCCGVIRDVPELDTYVGKTSDRMHIAYNEEVYTYNRDFSTTNKLHWVIVGDSYGRDFVNILREMGIEYQVEISYILFNEYKEKDKILRIKDADLVFRTASIYPDDDSFQKFLSFAKDIYLPTEKIRLVGSKRFGFCLGQIYRFRNKSDYFDKTIAIEQIYFDENKKAIEKYGNDMYIDMISPVKTSETNVRVFTDDKKIISQDCEHLTKNGAALYAELLRPIIEKEISKQLTTSN